MTVLAAAVAVVTGVARAQAPAAEPGAADHRSAITEPPKLTQEELAELRVTYDQAAPERRAELRAIYSDLGVDLGAALGIGEELQELAARSLAIVSALKEGGLDRSTAGVLAAAARLARSEAQPYPDAATASAPIIIGWLKERITAGSWTEVAGLLRDMHDGQSVYTAVLGALARGEANLLPEEIVPISEAAPGALTPQQLDLLAGLLRAAALRNGTAALIERIHAGTAWFGAGTPEHRRRTVELLRGAGLHREAYEFLPPLEEARASGDAVVLLQHAHYKRFMADATRESDRTALDRAEAWALFCEAAASPNIRPADRAQGMAEAIRLMRRLPRAMVTPWLEGVFSDRALGTLAIQQIALEAASLGDAKIERSERIHSVVVLKESVDILLAGHAARDESLRVPLRMLTATIAAEMEGALPAPDTPDGGGAAQSDRALLLRAIPGPGWLDAIEPSLALRTAGAAIELAACAGDTERALDLLRGAARRATPAQTRDLAERFLKRWATQLSGETDSGWISWWSRGHWRRYRTGDTGPVTRGRQRRNLAALREMIETLDAVGAEPRTLPSIAGVFTACHSNSEVYAIDDIVGVFGPLEQIPAVTARDLAERIAAAADQYWRDRLAQKRQAAAPAGAAAAGGKPPAPKRTDAEVIQVVDRGYSTAVRLAQRAQEAEPESWETDLLQSVLRFRQLRFNVSTGKVNDLTKLERLRDIYAELERAAASYAAALARGSQRETTDTFRLWFLVAMGSVDTPGMTREDLPEEGSLGDNQFDRIAAALRALPADVADRHIGELAAALDEAVDWLPPEVKPRFVSAALRVVGGHPAAAPIAARERLYRDLMKDEVKLRFTIDGPDEVRPGEPFGVALSLRFTNAVERETGGFADYLRNNVDIIGMGGYREINYKDLLRRELEGKLARNFTIAALEFYDPDFPSHGVIEGGQDGWLEKPMAYIILVPKDQSADRLPQVTMEMQFSEGWDTAVNVVTASDTPPISVTPAAPARPCSDLRITQVVDARDALASPADQPVRLEITSRARGCVPDLARLLTGVESALPGYSAGPDSIEAKPTVILSDAEVDGSRAVPGARPPYPDPDAAGVVQPVVERQWTVVYTPTGAAGPGVFRLPVLAAGVDAKLESSTYAELDIAPVTGATIDLGLRRGDRPFLAVALALSGAAVAAAGAIVLVRRRRGSRAAPPALQLPQRITPLSVVTTLRRWEADLSRGLEPSARAALASDIESIERRYFAPDADPRGGEDLAAVLQRWTRLHAGSAAGPDPRGVPAGSGATGRG